MRFLTKKDIVTIHERIMISLGHDSALRDEQMLDLVVDFAREYSDIFSVAVYYFTNLSMGLFEQGNKANALACMDIFLSLNGHVLQPDIDALQQIIVLSRVEDERLKELIQRITVPRASMR